MFSYFFFPKPFSMLHMLLGRDRIPQLGFGTVWMFFVPGWCLCRKGVTEF